MIKLKTVEEKCLKRTKEELNKYLEIKVTENDN